MVNELSNLVPDRKICEQFKVAGMPQGETALVWIWTEVELDTWDWETEHRDVLSDELLKECLAAPVAKEMLDMMPAMIDHDKTGDEEEFYSLDISKHGDLYLVSYKHFLTLEELDKPLPRFQPLLDTCSDILLWLAKEKYIWQDREKS